MKKIIERVLTAILVIMMTISGIAPSAMPISRVVNASSEVTEVEPTETPSPEPTLTSTLTPSPNPEESGEPTPSVEPEATPEVTPEVTPEITPEVTPEITPEVTPEVTPEFSFELFSIVNTSGTLDGVSYTSIIDISDGQVNTISADGVYLVTGGTGTGRIVVPAGFKVKLVLDGVNMSHATLAPIELQAGSEAIVHLASGTNNVLNCTGVSGSSRVAQAALYVGPATSAQPNAKLTIVGTGRVEAIGGYHSASIGGGPNEYCGDIMIVSGTVVARTRGSATQYNGAAIGGGGGQLYANLDPVLPAGTITINGTAVVEATALRMGAGIGGGGSEGGAASSGYGIYISGDTKVTASSGNNGAGIGGGGLGGANRVTSGENQPWTNTAGSGGIIKITGNAEVTARSASSGAGIGGGGVSGLGDATGAGIANAVEAGSAGDITISDDVKVTATGAGSRGTGIGGGGVATANAKITPGHGGIINISGDPIIVATGGARDLGAGTDGNSSTIVTVSDITIINGNVRADKDKSDPVKNNSGDILGRADVGLLADEQYDFDAEGINAGSYVYKATTNSVGEAFVWLPLGNQLVVDIDVYTRDVLGMRTLVFTAPNGTDVPVDVDATLISDGYNLIEVFDGTTAVNPPVEVKRTWTVPTAFKTVTYIYEHVNPPTFYALEENTTTWTPYTVGTKPDGTGDSIIFGTGPNDLKTPIISGQGARTVINRSGVYIVNNRIDNGTDRIVIARGTGKVVLIVNNANWTSNDTALDEGALVIHGDNEVLLVVMDGTKNSFVTAGRLQSVSGQSMSRLAGITVRSAAHESGATNDAKLVITGGQKAADYTPADGGFAGYNNTGSLFAKGAKYAAGIGGGCNQEAGPISIVASNVTAEATYIIETPGVTDNVRGGNGAGIGGGGGGTAGGGSSPEIKILGLANVKATALGSGAGIGGGGGGHGNAASHLEPGPGSSGNITIDGEKVGVTAKSMLDGAGIGGGGRSDDNQGSGGFGGAGDNIIIRAATVMAEAVGYGAGIGGGGAAYTRAGAGGNITIEDQAKVMAKSGVASDANSGQGAGIGGGGANDGDGGASGTIVIGTSDVTAISTKNGAGIGGGGGEKEAGDATNILIKDSAVITAKSGLNSNADNGQGAGIGGGGSMSSSGGDALSIEIINNAEITVASSAQNGAGIGGGGGYKGGGKAKYILITDSVVVESALSGIKGETSGGQGAGIGGGGSNEERGGDSEEIIINKDAIIREAVCIQNGAGIGGGGGPNGGGHSKQITIADNAQVLLARSGEGSEIDNGQGAGIGGGGSKRIGYSRAGEVIGGDSGTIDITTDNSSTIEAISTQNGAGIGGGGGNDGGGKGEIINITNATIKALSGTTSAAENDITGQGAGIGGGGSLDAYGGTGGAITIGDGAKVWASSTYNGAGIGGGGGPKGGGTSGTIVIRDDAEVSSHGGEYGIGAGIGGGGSLEGNAGDAIAITLTGDVVIEATSNGGGAAIGGGGAIGVDGNAAIGNGGNGGSITINKRAVVDVTAGEEGAGIGGGGTRYGTAGGGGNISISGETIVNAKSQLGAAIGGGSSATSGTPGHGGIITIWSEDTSKPPKQKSTIVVAESGQNDKGQEGLMDIGPGTQGDHLGDGIEGDIVIKSGNVLAANDKVYKPTNGRPGDIGNNNRNPVGRIEPPKTDNPGDTISYDVIGSPDVYEYLATSDANSETYMWIPYVTLTVFKEVDGGLADTTLPFDFELLLEQNGGPLKGDEKSELVYNEVDAKGLAITLPKKIAIDSTGRVEFKLTHGTGVRIRIPVASDLQLSGKSSEVKYKVIETATPNYNTTVGREVRDENNNIIINKLDQLYFEGTFGGEFIEEKVHFYNRYYGIVPTAVNIANSNFFGPMVAMIELMIIAALLMKYRRIKQAKAASRYFGSK